MDKIENIIGLVIAAVIGVAVIALLVSSNANTSSVLGTFFSGLSNVIGVAISPVTGQSVSGLSASGLTGSWVGSGGTTTLASAGGLGVNIGGLGSLIGGTNSLINSTSNLGNTIFGSTGGPSSSNNSYDTF